MKGKKGSVRIKQNKHRNKQQPNQLVQQQSQLTQSNVTQVDQSNQQQLNQSQSHLKDQPQIDSNMIDVDNEIYNLQQQQLEEIRESQMDHDEQMALYTENNPMFNPPPSQQRYKHPNGRVYRPRYNHQQRQQSLQNPHQSSFISSRYAVEAQIMGDTGYGPTRNVDYYAQYERTNHDYGKNYNNNNNNTIITIITTQIV